MSSTEAVQLGGVLLALATLLGTVVPRALPHGAARRLAEDYAIVLGCAAPAVAVVAPYYHQRLWPAAAVIAVAYGGFYLIRMRQLRRADRDSLRRLLGLHRDATFGEVAQQMEAIEPRPVTAGGRLVLAVGAAAVLIIGQALGRFDPALIGLGLGVADGTLRAAYRRALARKVREIGH